MELDEERSGHLRENKLCLTFMDTDCCIGIELDSENAKKLKSFLNDVLGE